LEKSLWGFATQTLRDFEVVIADDGSGPPTRETIDRTRHETGLSIQHVWHEDCGFRKCTILNRAIMAAQGNYLVFTDGDCIPRRDFLEVHHRLAAPGRFLSGGYFKLPLELSRIITRDDIAADRATRATWLRACGLRWSRKNFKISTGPLMAKLLDTFTTTRATWNGQNASGWKADLIRVNGFDERMEYGGLDRELGERLMNAGLRGKLLRYRAVCVHLDHARGYARPDSLARNQAIRRETRRTRAVWTAYGIVKQSRPALVHAA
ncbi:MAG TPA: glycosyltransferase, partial [Pirellulales bacterium]|nr:glycosyltransferase [Pirellulales bacterium]